MLSSLYHKVAPCCATSVLHNNRVFPLGCSETVRESQRHIVKCFRYHQKQLNDVTNLFVYNGCFLTEKGLMLSQRDEKLVKMP